MALRVAGISGGGAVCARATAVPPDQSRPQANPVLAIRLVTDVRFILISLFFRGLGWLESCRIDRTPAELMDPTSLDIELADPQRPAPSNQSVGSELESLKSIVCFGSAMIAVCIRLCRLMGHHDVTFPPVAIVTSICERIARSQILAFCVGIELRAIPGVFDNLLRQNGCCESCRGNSNGANDC